MFSFTRIALTNVPFSLFFLSSSFLSHTVHKIYIGDYQELCSLRALVLHHHFSPSKALPSLRLVGHVVVDDEAVQRSAFFFLIVVVPVPFLLNVSNLEQI